jgi:hypothetical protein
MLETSESEIIHKFDVLFYFRPSSCSLKRVFYNTKKKEELVYYYYFFWGGCVSELAEYKRKQLNVLLH